MCSIINQCPQQSDGSQCGIYAIEFTRRVLENSNSLVELSSGKGISSNMLKEHLDTIFKNSFESKSFKHDDALNIRKELLSAYTK
jgi:Ulp1 family protease